MAHTENLTIMFTDVVGYTQRTSAQSRVQIRELLKRCSRILLPIVRRYGGWQVKNLGDALLIAFHSPTDALRCGMAQHDAIAASNRGLPEEQHLHIRVAVTLGEVLVQDHDVFGEAVNLAARLESVTPPDHLYFTESVYLAMNKAEVPSQVVGTEQFKGIPEPVKIYQVPARQVARLVTTGEPMSQLEPELPFGGIHLAPVEVRLRTRLRGRWQEWRMQAGQAGDRVGQRVSTPRLLLPALAVLALAAAGGWWLTRMPVEPSVVQATVEIPPPATPEAQPAAAAPSLLVQAQPLVAARKYGELRALYRAHLARNPNDAEALLLQGHDLFHQDQRREGVAAYRRALAANPKLQEDRLLAQNLARGLSWAAEEATPLIRKHATPALIDALAARTGESDAPRARQRAADLLTELGHAKRIDQAGWALQDLREAKTCEQRLDAVRRLRPLKYRPALPHLEALMGGGLSGWWEHRCVRDEAEAAIAEIARK